MIEKWNGENFEKRLKEAEGLAVVEFYTDTCPSCKTMGMILEAIATEWAQSEPRVCFAQVNVAEEERLRKQFQLRAVPTILVFRRGKPVVESMGSIGKGRLQELIRSAM